MDYLCILNMAFDSQLTKTKVMIFGSNRRKHEQHEFYFNSEKVEIVHEYKYVGIPMASVPRNHFKEVYTHFANQSKRAIYKLKADVNENFGYLPFELSLKMFESVHLTYLKNSLGVGIHTCTHAVYAETGRFPLEIRQKISMIKYWFRIIHLPESHVLKKCYNTLYSLMNLGQNKELYAPGICEPPFARDIE
jgi:hypothetical protein